MKSSDLLIIIPAYNEEASIVSVVDNIIQNYSQYDLLLLMTVRKIKHQQFLMLKAIILLIYQ